MPREITRRILLAGVVPLSLAGALAGCVSENRYEELEKAYAQLQGKYTADQATIQMLQGRLKITMSERILFPSGGIRIEESAKRELAKLVPTLQGLQQTRIVVEGYTDTTPVGAELRREGISSNLDLSSRRADTVADTLIQQGVPRNNISASGRGDANPVASNDTAAGRAQNRRIEVTLVGPGN